MILRHELEEKVKDNYGSRDKNWGDLSVFQGDYINFGYWKNISFSGPLTTEDRVSSSAALYQYVITTLNPTNSDVVVELGCGRGVGALNALPYIEYKALIAIDLSEAQIVRTALNKKKWKSTNLKQIMQIESVKYQIECLEREWKLEEESNQYVREEFKHKIDNLSHLVSENSRVKDLKARIADLLHAVTEVTKGDEKSGKELDKDFKLHMEVLHHQVEIKAKLTQKLDSFEFQVASAYSTGLPDHSVSKIFSVEVLQHVNDFPALSTEIKRILIPGGSFVFCAHFSTNQDSQNKLFEENLLIDETEILIPVGMVESSFKQNGFDVHYHSIGEFVFDGYERWVKQIDSTGDVSHKIGESYQAGYIDYYVFELSLPNKIGEGSYSNGCDEM